MSLNINGRIKVKTLKSDFKNEFGLTIRVYDGRSFADEDATLASIRKGDSTGGEFSPKRNTKVGNLEDKLMELFGLKTQVAGSDDSYLCNNDLTLSGALEEDEKKLGRKEKKTTTPTENKESSNSNDEASSALTDEESFMSEFDNADSIDEWIALANKAIKMTGKSSLLESAIGNAIYSASEYDEFKKIADCVGSSYGNIRDTDWAIEIMKKAAEDLEDYGDVEPVKVKLRIEQWNDDGSDMLDDKEDDHEYEIMLPRSLDICDVIVEITGNYPFLREAYNNWCDSSHSNSLEIIIRELTYDDTVYSSSNDSLDEACDAYYEYKMKLNHDLKRLEY